MSEKWSNYFAFGVACFVVIWSITVLIFAAPPLVDRHAFSFKSESATSVSDFVHFYQCGAMTLSPERTKVYDPTVQKEFTNKLISPDHIDQAFYIQYVPYTFPLMVPLAVLTMEQAYTLWYLVSLAAGAVAIRLLLRDVGRFSKRDSVIFFFGTLLSVPSVIALKIGQTSWFLLLFLSLYYLGLKHKRNVSGGVGLALLSIKPQYMPLLVVTAFANRSWGLLGTAVAIGIALLVLAGCSIGWDNVVNYPQILLHAESYTHNSGVNPEGMVSLRGVLSQFLPQKAVLAIAAVMLVAGAVLTVMLWRPGKLKPVSIEWAMALTVVLCLVVSPHSHVYDLLFLVVPAILTLPSLSLMKIAAMKNRWLLLWSVILLSYPVAGWLAYCAGVPWMIVVLNLILLLSGTLSVFAEGAVDFVAPG